MWVVRKACKGNEKQPGGFLGGRTFRTVETVSAKVLRQGRAWCVGRRARRQVRLQQGDGEGLIAGDYIRRPKRVGIAGQGGTGPWLFL